MGYIRNHTIVVSASQAVRLHPAHDKALELFGEQCSQIVLHAVNGGAAFFVAPDGSKEGWAQSDEGDEARNSLCEFLEAQHPWVDWAEIVLGSDDGEYRIERTA